MSRRRLVLLRTVLILQALFVLLALGLKPFDGVWIWRRSMEAMVDELIAAESDGVISINDAVSTNELAGRLVEPTSGLAVMQANTRFKTHLILFGATLGMLALAFWPVRRPPVQSRVDSDR